MENVELLPCPFCGGRAGKGFAPASLPENAYREDRHIIACSKCDMGFTEATLDRAAERWNTRVEAKETP